jgi:hypothetical protein
MKLVFFDRQTTPAPPANSPLLTIERKGTFGLSTAAVAGLGLKPNEHLALAQDTETNTWYLLLNPKATLGLRPFELRARDSKNNRSLIFCSQPQSRAYYAAHGLGQEKSVRASVVLEPIAHEGLQLYPLQPQHATATVPTSDAVPVEDVSWKRPAPVTALAPEVVPAAPVAAPVVPASAPASTKAPVVDTTEGLSREELLAEEWNERDITKATDAELTELIKVLGGVPSRQRGFVEDKVLSAAKKEQQARGKKGGNRG